jgi:hypothetical protein
MSVVSLHHMNFGHWNHRLIGTQSRGKHACDSKH